MAEAGINTPPGVHGAAALAARRRAARPVEDFGRTSVVATCRVSQQPGNSAADPRRSGSRVRACRRHPAVFAYLIGNEIPPDMVRWHGADAVRSFLRSLVACAKTEHPEALVSYANYPSTEYLTVDFTDFVCFNVYLHDQPAFRRYIARLHNVALDQPLVLTEFGVDSFGEGEEEQRRVLSWQVHTAFEAGVSRAPSSSRGQTNGSPAVIWWRIGPLVLSTETAGRNRHSTRWCANTPASCRRRCGAIRGFRSSSAPTRGADDEPVPGFAGSPQLPGLRGHRRQ